MVVRRAVGKVVWGEKNRGEKVGGGEHLYSPEEQTGERGLRARWSSRAAEHHQKQPESGLRAAEESAATCGRGWTINNTIKATPSESADRHGT